jgi:arsenate reductase
MIKTQTTSVKDFFENTSKKITISQERKLVLFKIAETISKIYASDKVVYLNFICTHNSRRSQLAQVWGFYAAHYFNLNIKSFSGGTEVTAFYRNTVKTLQKAGFIFQLEDFSHQNPKYSISFDESKKSLLGFSKLFNYQDNLEPYMAITTCNNADKNCPYIPEASYRFHLPFVDPKFSDGTADYEKEYLKTNMQIAGEIFFIFSSIKKLLSSN